MKFQDNVFRANFGNGESGHDGSSGGGSSDGGSGGGGMEARIARLESDVHHIDKSVSDIKDDVRSLRTEFGDLRNDARSDFRWLLGFMVGTGLTIAGMLAKGFGWF